MNIDSIRNGIVIDHIEAGKAMKIYKFLNLDAQNCAVAMIMNASSHRMGKKDIIKIDTILDVDLNVIGFIDPNVTIALIKDGELVHKYQPELPNVLVDVLKCHNPRCITSSEQELTNIFTLTDREHTVYRCKYCDTKAKVK